jgi:flagella basal body P-ring formation protein FlgA
MTISAFISLLVAFLLMNPSIKEEATKAKVLELAAASLEQRLDVNAYQFELTARWIPNSLLQVGPENIQSVSISGNIEEYTRFNVIHQTRAGRKTSEIQLRVEADQLVVVAIDRVRNSELLQADQFELQWKPVRLGRDRFITEIDEIDGKSIRRNLSPGQPIRVHEISSPILVIPGQEVAMIFSQGAVQLGLNCESRQSGSVGEEVQIYCEQIRKKYTAKVIGAGEVQWLRTN